MNKRLLDEKIGVKEKIAEETAWTDTILKLCKALDSPHIEDS